MFGFTKIQDTFRQEVQTFVRGELAQGAEERAKLDFFPMEIRKKLANRGFLGLSVPSKYGGKETDRVSMGIVVEEISKVDFAAAARVGMDVSYIGPVLQEGTETVQQEWLPSVANGEKMFCLALTESDFGSDLAGIQTRAIRDGDFYVLNGEKTSILWGMQADAAIMLAKTDPKAGARGITCFLVPLDLPGIDRSPILDMGWKPIGRASMIMDNVRLPAIYRLGEEGKGLRTMMKDTSGRANVVLAGIGQAQASIEQAITYARQRIQFGRPIAKFEGISFKIAEDATLIEAARLLCYRTLWLADQQLPHFKEAAMCKWFGARVAVRTIHDSLLIHGQVGIRQDYGIEQRLRDAIGLELAEGSFEIMMINISREIIGKEFLPY